MMFRHFFDNSFAMNSTQPAVKKEALTMLRPAEWPNRRLQSK